MITNLCPYNGNEQWCPNPGGINQYGYSWHFDLMDLNLEGTIEALGWDNPEVVWEPAPCGEGGAPPTSDWETCICYGMTGITETYTGTV